ncbi:MAG: hypothetical protein ACFCVE_16125 [Phycisphaerae bacterium]
MEFSTLSRKLGLAIRRPAAAASAARAAVSLPVVDDATHQARQAICRSCPHSRDLATGRECGLCSCGVDDRSGRLDLTRYVEDEDIGCKHPDRAAGAGWNLSTR